jgi:hypothetical protein
MSQLCALSAPYTPPCFHICKKVGTSLLFGIRFCPAICSWHSVANVHSCPLAGTIRTVVPISSRLALEHFLTASCTATSSLEISWCGYIPAVRFPSCKKSITDESSDDEALPKPNHTMDGGLGVPAASESLLGTSSVRGCVQTPAVAELLTIRPSTLGLVTGPVGDFFDILKDAHGQTSLAASVDLPDYTASFSSHTGPQTWEHTLYQGHQVLELIHFFERPVGGSGDNVRPQVGPGATFCVPTGRPIRVYKSVLLDPDLNVATQQGHLRRRHGRSCG